VRIVKTPPRGQAPDEKFLIDLFSKRSQGLGAEPQVAPAGAKPPFRHFFGSFFVPTCSKKERKQFSHISPQQLTNIVPPLQKFVFYIEVLFSVLFEQGAAKKNIFRCAK
jgi:hypothetical protein